MSKWTIYDGVIIGEGIEFSYNAPAHENLRSICDAHNADIDALEAMHSASIQRDNYNRIRAERDLYRARLSKVLEELNPSEFWSPHTLTKQQSGDSMFDDSPRASWCARYTKAIAIAKGRDDE